MQNEHEASDGVCAAAAVVEKFGEVGVAFFHDVLLERAHEVAQKLYGNAEFPHGVGDRREYPAPLGVERVGGGVELGFEFFEVCNSYGVVGCD